MSYKFLIILSSRRLMTSNAPHFCGLIYISVSFLNSVINYLFFTMIPMTYNFQAWFVWNQMRYAWWALNETR